MSENIVTPAPPPGEPPSFATPPPVSPPSQPPLPQAGTSIDATVSTGDIQSNVSNVVAHLEINQILPDPAKPDPFSVGSASEITPDDAEMLEALFVADEKLIDDFTTSLEKHRVLLLAGERGRGKETLAVYLSTVVARREKLGTNALKVEPLARTVHIDVEQIAANAADFGSRTTIFVDVFARHNRGLEDFFDRTARVGWEGLAATLRASSAFLIFTTEMHDVEKLRRLGSCLACRAVPPLTRDLVIRGTDRRIERLKTNKLASAEHLRALVTQRDRLIDELSSLQRVARFLEFFPTGEPDLETALRVFNDVGGSWFGQDLAADVDAWCFALTLTLAGAHDANGVGWYEFETIRRAITERVKSDTELFPRRRRSESQQEQELTEHTTGQSLSDDLLLIRCRAEIGRDSSRVGDAVRFRDDTYASRIWRHAVTHNRRVLTLLVPALRVLAEGAGDYGVRAMAAQMIGRIGELDPFSISIPIVRNAWPRNERHRPLVGSLLLGIRASEDERYKQSGMGAIDALTADRPGDVRAESDGILTAISAYSQLGEENPDDAMERLGTIAVEKLAPVMDDLNEIGRVVDIVDRTLARTSSKQTAEDLLNQRFRLAQFAKARSRRAAAIMAMAHAVVYLCLTGDSVQILRAMRAWISKGKLPGGTLVALLFLVRGGIAEELESVSANMRSLTGGSAISPIVFSLANGRDAIEHFSAFLADVYSSIHGANSLPEALQQDLRDSLDECLTRWARSSAALSAHRDAAADLFVALTTVRNGAMRNYIYGLFGSSPFTDEPVLRDFAAEVRRKRLQRAGDFSFSDRITPP